MTGGVRALADYPEIAVVLGAGLKDDSTPNDSTLARADAAASLADARDIAFIVSGSHGYEPTPEHTEAFFMAERLAARGVARSRIFSRTNPATPSPMRHSSPNAISPT